MAKKEEKYQWRIGFPPPDIDRHSLTKHTIIEEYVRRYVLTLMKPANIPELKLTIVDGFCGGGCYLTEDNELTDGSPLLVMRAVRESRAELNLTRNNPRTINVDYHFVDISPDTTAYLKNFLQAKLDESKIDKEDFDRTNVVTSSFFEQLPSIVQKIKQRKGGEHALFLLDQYCYKDIPLPQIKGILANLKSAEVLMTFGVDNLTTYLADRAANRKPINEIGLDKYIPWQDIKLLKATHKREWRQILQKYLADGIKKETCADNMTLFFVKPFGDNTWSYWLIHLSNNYRAHDVMKTLHWKHSTEFAHELEPGHFLLGYDANHDFSYTGQETFEFGSEASKESCVSGVAEHLGEVLFKLNQPVMVRDLFKQVITNTTANEALLMDSLRLDHQSKKVIVTSKDNKLKRINKAYQLSDVIEPSKQTSIYFCFPDEN
ncbi:three-Cys-motif partner protein TcmP [Methylovulum miyakonense]|uniref:three-Cys-motif partner protein TcmP n=1 Tax=Methylovulum miyakonense TaxID=645578 RepID=UPI000364B043|nr:three-Cys-motif partner protein TcmP [Methylovulum miyakonense]